MHSSHPFIKGTDFEGNAYYFYDVNAKANYRFSDKDRLFLSGYFGRDVFNYRSPDDDFNVEVPWGECRRYPPLESPVQRPNVHEHVGHFQRLHNFEVSSAFDQFDFKLYSGVRDWNFKTDFDYYLNANHTFKYGVNYIYHAFHLIVQGSSGGAEFGTDSLNKVCA